MSKRCPGAFLEEEDDPKITGHILVGLRENRQMLPDGEASVPDQRG